MQTIYQKMETTELDAAIEALKAEVVEVKAKGLALDMARGKPSPSQVDISRPMLDILNADADLHDGNVDCSNYGCFEGIPSARKLAGEFLGCPAEQTLVLGSSSLADRARYRRHVLALRLMRQRALGRLTRPRTTARRSSSCARFPATTATLASPPIWVSRTFPSR